ncbi:MAG TPA: lamin tail domain-containing protein [Polyangia bacterium]|nr:lamin tail domain-containing protein [Polyangia bacterium]
MHPKRPRTPVVPTLSLCALFILAACGAPPVDTESVPSSGEQSLTGTVRVRVMAGNLTSGNNQSYDPGNGTRIFQGTHPDVVLIQEFNYGTNSATDIRQFVDTAFGTTFSYFREGGAQIPNGVISRWPIIASGEWDDTSVSNRDFAWARIDIPGPIDLWAVSMHLLTTSSSVRNTEASQLVSYIKQNIPAGDYLVIGGDFNTGSRTEGCISTLSQVVATASPYPADRNGNGNTNASRGSPYDWVLADSDLNAYRTSTIIGASTFTSGLVADTRVYSPISEISPALSSDSGATNMQHMGVVRDFLVPGDAAASVTLTAPNGGESWPGGSIQNITWTASGVTSVKLEYTLDGTNWNLITSSVSASAGSYAWTVPNTASSAARVRVSDAANAATSATSSGTFTITVAGTGQVFINEILANEPGSDTAGEFVELVNTGSAAVDLTGWTISDSTNVRHTFGAYSLGAGRAVVVFGGATAIPAGLTNALAASTATLGLANSGDSVTLTNGSGQTVDSFTYPSSLASTDGVSMNRNPDGSASGTFVLHTSLSTSLSSPGRRTNGTAF